VFFKFDVSVRREACPLFEDLASLLKQIIALICNNRTWRSASLISSLAVYQMFSMYLRARMNDKMNILLNTSKYVRVSEMV